MHEHPLKVWQSHVKYVDGLRQALQTDLLTIEEIGQPAIEILKADGSLAAIEVEMRKMATQVEGLLSILQEHRISFARLSGSK